MLYRFISFNRDLCNRIERRLPHTQSKISMEYETTVARYMNDGANRTVVDVGGGRFCPFTLYKDPAMKPRIIAVDASEAELAINDGVEEKHVADITRGLPLGEGTADLIVSRYTLEHLEDMEAFLAHCHPVLKSGGHLIHLIPCRYAPFAIFNRMLPHTLSHRLNDVLRPEARGIGGFPTVYDRCYPSGVERMLTRQGYRPVEWRLSYYQSRYYNFFVPLYLASAGYEVLIRSLGWTDLCAYLLFVAQKE